MTDHAGIVVTVLSDPVCEVQPGIEGRDTALTCRMVYDWQPPHGRQFNAPPGLSVSLSWDGVPGTTVTTTADPNIFRGTLETNTTTDVMSETFPSYTCTIQFDFLPGHSNAYQYAVNSVSSTCVTASRPTTVQRKFKITVNQSYSVSL